jgi:hypothetical protein
MSDVKAKLESIRTSVNRLRDQVPGTDWQQAATLKALAELSEILLELAAGTPAAAVAGKPAEDRGQQLQRLSWMACRVLPAGLDGELRDAEICRILERWNVSRDELCALGYTRAEVLVTPAARRARAACVR